MSLFDMFKDKATELVQSAEGQFAALTGAEPTVDGVTDAVTGEANAVADGVTGSGADQAGQVAQSAEDLQQGQDLTDSAGSAATDIVNRFLGNL